MRWFIVAGLVACAVGVALPWFSTFLASVSGINTGDGQFFAVVLAAAALVSWWRWARPNRVNGTILVVLWVGMAAIAIYEMVNVSTIFTASVMGSGLYVCAIGSSAGTVAAVVDVSRSWNDYRFSVSASPVWLPLLAAVVAVLALGGAAYGGHQHGTNVRNSLDNLLHTGGSSTRTPGTTGNSGAGNFGNSGSTGSSGFGNTGSTGSSGFGNSGSTGSSGFGNSGSTGSSTFGNSGSSGIGLGNSGSTGNT